MLWHIYYHLSFTNVNKLKYEYNTYLAAEIKWSKKQSLERGKSHY